MHPSVIQPVHRNFFVLFGKVAMLPVRGDMLNSFENDLPAVLPKVLNFHFFLSHFEGFEHFFDFR